MAHDSWFNPEDDEEKNGRYGVNGKVLLSAVICLLSVVFFIILLHLYARCYLRRRAQQRSSAMQQRSLGLTVANRSQEPPKTGLDPIVVESLPTFLYKHEMASIECTVCLSTIEEDETVRLLPNCNHAFHISCIDLWLHSHSTCPVCRTPAEPMVVESVTATGIAEGTLQGASAPPFDSASNLEEGSLQEAQSSKPSASVSRMSSFRRILSRDRSERRLQACVHPATVEQDIERQ